MWERQVRGLAAALTGAAVVSCWSSVGARNAARAVCASEPSSVAQHEQAPAPITRGVVVLMVDGVRWQEVFSGADPAITGGDRSEGAISARDLMPNLHALADGAGAVLGAPDHGAEIAASGPHYVSLPGYHEVFAGHPGRCADNHCAPASSPTLVDELRGRGACDGSVAVFASWAPIADAASSHPECVVMSTGRHRAYGADVLREDHDLAVMLDDAADADPAPGHDDFRPDRFTAAIALRYLETHRPRFLFVGLGEPDEYAHLGNYPGYLGAVRAVDRVLGDLLGSVRRLEAEGYPMTLIMTTDHGRGRDYRHHGRDFPESGRVWLAAAGAGIAQGGFVSAPDRRHLADVAPTLRALLGLAADPSRGAGTVMTELLTTNAGLSRVP